MEFILYDERGDTTIKPIKEILFFSPEDFEGDCSTFSVDFPCKKPDEIWNKPGERVWRGINKELKEIEKNYKKNEFERLSFSTLKYCKFFKRSKRVFILNGLPESGKDTFVEMVNNYFPSIHYSYVSKTKDICGEFLDSDSEVEKNQKTRQLWADMNKVLEDYDDIPFKDICQITDDFLNGECTYYTDEGKLAEYGYLFIDIRDPDVIKRFCEKYPETKTILIKKPSKVDTSKLTDIDKKVLENEDIYDIVIKNNSILEGLDDFAFCFATGNFCREKYKYLDSERKTKLKITTKVNIFNNLIFAQEKESGTYLCFDYWTNVNRDFYVLGDIKKFCLLCPDEDDSKDYEDWC